MRKVLIYVLLPGAVRAPAEFVVTRHLITHPDDAPSQIAEHTGLHATTVSRVLKRLQEDRIYTDEQRLVHLRSLAERPEHKEIDFEVPNPDQFIQMLEQDSEVGVLLGGEDAAVHDGYNLVPEHHLVYIDPGDWAEVAAAAEETLAKLAPRSGSNLTVREMDPWLTSEQTGTFVERGQRLLDYQESKHVQLARSLDEIG